LIFGARSNLSVQLSKHIDNCVLISTASVLDDNKYLQQYNNKKIKIIINSFYPATKLNDALEPVKYIENSLLILAKIFEQISLFSLHIDKIIYTSSASVYGNNNYCSENDSLLPLSLHSSLKISSEKFCEKFCKENNIDFTIARVFNMYGGNDSFSIISKILYNTLNNNKITLVNNGSAIRDYIYIEDVVHCYKQLLITKDNNIVNIASGKGISIKMILDYLSLKGYSTLVENITKEEIKVSTANVNLLNKLIDIDKFQSVVGFIENYLSSHQDSK
jgi:UDP-glucose 4-epimerase